MHEIPEILAARPSASPFLAAAVLARCRVGLLLVIDEYSPHGSLPVRSQGRFHSPYPAARPAAYDSPLTEHCVQLEGRPAEFSTLPSYSSPAAV